MNILSLRSIHAGYHGVDVLHDIHFEVNQGEFFCIIGPNGCGKTTLLRVIAGLLPFRGEVFFQHMSLRKMNRRDIASQVALLSQLSQLYFAYTIYDTVMQGRYHHLRGLLKAPSAMDHDTVKRCLHTVGLWEMKDRLIDTLSGGQLQRVFLARTLAQEPSIILLDEPTNHLDLKHQMELMEALRKWCHETNCAVVGVLHDINLALTFSDRILLLREGRALACGTPEDVLAEDHLQTTFDMDVAGYMKRTLAQWEHLS